MKIKDILAKCDHTLLKQTATLAEIKTLCDEAIKYKVASVCIPPSYVHEASEYLNGQIPICTVIGFPNGYETTSIKLLQAEEAIHNGASEIDMVINLGWAKDHQWNKITDEIREIKNVCNDRVLKVIIETCLLTDDEKITLCKCVTDAGADFIKTSTGFSNEGATLYDVTLLYAHVGTNVKVKAAGGVNDLEAAKEFLENGADRLGTSKVVKIVRESRWQMEDEV